MSGSHPDRIKAACLYVLDSESAQAGHVYAEAEELLPAVKKLLEEKATEVIPYEAISEAIIKLGEERKVIAEGQQLYLPSLFFSEKGIVTNIKRILNQTEFNEQFPESEFLLALGQLEERLSVQYAPSQKMLFKKR